MSAENQFLICLLIVIALGILLFLIGMLLLVKYFFDRFKEIYDMKLFHQKDILRMNTRDIDYFISKIYTLYKGKNDE